MIQRRSRPALLVLCAIAGLGVLALAGRPRNVLPRGGELLLRGGGRLASVPVRAPEWPRRLGELEDRLRGERSAPAASAELGVLLALVDRPEDGVRALESALAERPDHAEWLTDLSALHLSVAAKQPPEQGLWLARALEFSERALERAPGSPPAQHNRALALEGLGLGPRKAGPTHKDLGPERIAIEEELLPRWADAWLAGHAVVAEEVLAEAVRRAAALRAAGGDELLPAHLARLGSVPRDQRRRLAEAHSAFGRGLRHAAVDAWSEAAREFAAAESLFGRETFATWAAAQRGIAFYYSGQGPRAREVFDEALPRAPADTALRARLLWLRGLMDFNAGRPLDALADFSEAVGTFAQLHEEGHEGFLRVMLASCAQAVGRIGPAWEQRLLAMRHLPQVADPRRAYAIHAEAADALDPHLPRATRHVLDDGVVRGDHGKDDVVTAFALIRRARTSIRMGRLAPAAADLARAQALPLVDSWRRRLAPEIDVALAWLDRERAPATAVGRLTRAIERHEREGRRFEHAQLLQARAGARRASGDPAAAIADLGEALRIHGQLTPAGSSPSPEARLAHAEQIDLLVRQGDERAAFQASDATPWRRVRVGEARGGEVPDEGLVVEALLTGETLLLRWRGSREGAKRFARPGASMVALVADARREVRVARMPGCPEGPALRALAQALLAPLDEALRVSKRVAFVLHGALRDVPLVALPLPSGPGCLVQSHAVRMASSWTWAADEFGVTEFSGSILAIGHPGDSTAVGRLGLPKLRRAEAEASAVAELWRGKALTGQAATRERVLRGLEQNALVHVAAHGVESGDGGAAALLLAPSPEGDVLYASMLAGRSLKGLRLAVLAACSTAESTVHGDPPPLATALLRAGARGVVAAAWPVGDATTEPFLRAFHKRLAAGTPAAQALAETQREALKTGVVPAATWAAFQLLGGDSGRLRVR